MFPSVRHADNENDILSPRIGTSNSEQSRKSARAEAEEELWPEVWRETIQPFLHVSTN